MPKKIVKAVKAEKAETKEIETFRHQMLLSDLLSELDGCGLVITDEELISETLIDLGFEMESIVVDNPK